MIRSPTNRLGSRAFHFYACAIAGFALISSQAHGVPYTFTKIADSAGPFRDFAPTPSINNAGTVAFLAALDSGPPGLFIGAGVNTTKVADVGGAIAEFGLAPTINASGTVGFAAMMDNGEQRIYSGDTTAIAPLASTSGPLRTVGIVGAIAADGKVAFAGQLDTGPIGVFRADAGGMTTIATYPGGVSPTLAQSANGIVAYQAVGFTGPGIFTTAAGTATPIVDITGQFAFFSDGMSINGNGMVAFAGGLDNGRRGIFTHNGGMTKTIADTSSTFNSFEVSPSPPAVNLTRPGLNESGQVAFLARLNNGSLGIFTGTDPIADAVIKTGQMLDGAIVNNLGFYGALNDSGRLAFTAQLSNGRQGVFVATPVLPPPTWRVDADGNWSQTGNWTGGVPNGIGSEAILGSIITAPRTIALDIPVTVGRIAFDNAESYTLAGTNAVTLDATSANAQIDVANGNHLIGAPVTLADNAVFTVTPAASNLSITAALDARGVTLTKTGAGALTINYVRTAGLSVNSGTLAIQPDGGPLVVSALQVAGDATPTAKIDLDNSAAIVDYPAAGPNPVAMIRNLIIVGRGGTGLGKPWNGKGITSSTAQADVAAGPNSRSIGYAVNADLPLGALTSFRGQAVDPSSVLIRYTRTADANLDGVVNDDDVTVVGTFYAPGVAKPEWAKGDFDFNGFVDDDDVTLLGVFYNPAATPIPAPAAGDATVGGAVAAVPEPASIALLAVAICLAMTRRLRRTGPR